MYGAPWLILPRWRERAGYAAAVSVFTHGDIHPGNILVDTIKNDDDGSSSSNGVKFSIKGLLVVSCWSQM